MPSRLFFSGMLQAWSYKASLDCFETYSPESPEQLLQCSWAANHTRGWMFQWKREVGKTCTRWLICWEFLFSGYFRWLFSGSVNGNSITGLIQHYLEKIIAFKILVDLDILNRRKKRATVIAMIKWSGLCGGEGFFKARRLTEHWSLTK